MSDIVQRLHELRDWLLKNDMDMKMPAGMIDPEEAADEIERFRAELDAVREVQRTTLVKQGEQVARLKAEVERLKDGNRPLPMDRETLGRMVREAWVRWAETQPSPKPSWLVPYDQLSEPDKEADRQIGEAIARWTLVHDSARAALTAQPSNEEPRT